MVREVALRGFSHDRVVTILEQAERLELAWIEMILRNQELEKGVLTELRSHSKWQRCLVKVPLVSRT